jgi:hypothetical protein
MIWPGKAPVSPPSQKHGAVNDQMVDADRLALDLDADARQVGVVVVVWHATDRGICRWIRNYAGRSSYHGPRLVT